MTDQELLELAAKAAGYEIEVDQYEVIYCHEGSGPQSWAIWNPLTCDGDALRLACKLALVVYCDEVEAWCEWGELNEDLEYEHHVSAEPEYKGTQSVRRAIVLAAAEIGRGEK